MPSKPMPPAIEEMHEELWQDVATVHLRYQFLIQLFGDQESVDLLNRFAPALFENVFAIMLEHVLLRLAHLTDPARVPSNPNKMNQSLYLLMDVIEQDSPDLTEALGIGTAMVSLRAACDGMRELRNRLLAHRDWGRRAEALPAVNRSQIDEALGRIAWIMNAISMHYRGAEVRFDSVFSIGTAEELIQHLGDLARRLDIEQEPWRR